MKKPLYTPQIFNAPADSDFLPLSEHCQQLGLEPIHLPIRKVVAFIDPPRTEPRDTPDDLPPAA